MHTMRTVLKPHEIQVIKIAVAARCGMPLQGLIKHPPPPRTRLVSMSPRFCRRCRPLLERRSAGRQTIAPR